MRPLFYLIAYIPGITALVTLGIGGIWTWCVPILIFGLVPAVELFVHGKDQNPSLKQERVLKKNLLYPWLLYGIVPLQVGVVATLIWGTSTHHYSGLSWLGAIVTTGIACGMYGLNVGHELCHRQHRMGRNAALILMATSLYPHFLLEHTRGHHRHVATPQDPASARLGQWIYGFWIQSVVGGFRSAWALDRRHVSKVWGATLVVLISVGVVFGIEAVVGWTCSALIGIGLLETVNYLEHYGLSRKRLDNGKYERPAPHHSWNANHPLGRALLFELTRHSDHHAYPGRRFQVLRSHTDAPRLPSGYPGMILCALIPPLFCRLMTHHLNKERQRIEALRAA